MDTRFLGQQSLLDRKVDDRTSEPKEPEVWPGKRTLTAALEYGGGAQLPGELRTDLESSLGTGLGGVRLQAGSEAAAAAAALNARAFTYGQVVYFGDGQYDPTSAAGQQLIAHEVAHTVQQSGVASSAASDASIGVSAPGDRHETEAERFADSFAAQRNTTPAVRASKSTPQMPAPMASRVSPVSQGIIARAIIQREMLPGGIPRAGTMLIEATPISISESPDAEIRNGLSRALRGARSGGPTQVATQVRQLRQSASGSIGALLEQVIASDLNDAERSAISGQAPNQSPRTPTTTQSGNTPAATQAPSANRPTQQTNTTSSPATGNRQGSGASGSWTGAQPSSGATTTAQSGNTATTQGASGTGTQQSSWATTTAESGNSPTGGTTGTGQQQATGGATTAESGNTATEGGPATGQATGGGGQTAAQGGAEAVEGGNTATRPAPGGGGQGGATVGPSHGATISQGPAPAAAAAPAGPTAGGDRALIEGELAFHDNWAALSRTNEDGSPDRGARAAHLLFGTGGPGYGAMGDIGSGMAAGAMQSGFGLAAALATSRGPLARIPGAGAILGGALAAHSLFSNGGAGIKKLGGDMAKGFGNAMSASAWKESPWLTAADLVGGIKALVDTIGSVCNILSGLAYAFAAIAAVGGLLSVLFPPLAFLVPYIPAAINFGRALGGIAAVCSAVSTVLSPIPPILRAIHIIFSNQDPLLLVAEEASFHDEMQGAVASWTSASIDRGVATNPRMQRLLNKPAPTGPQSFNPVTQLHGAITGGAGNVRSGVADGRAALATRGPTPAPSQASALGRSYGDTPESRAAATPELLAEQQRRLAEVGRNRQGVDASADRAQREFEANNSARGWDRYVARSETADRHAAIVDGQTSTVAVTQQRLAIGNHDQHDGDLGGQVSTRVWNQVSGKNDEAAAAASGTDSYNARQAAAGPAAPVPVVERNDAGRVQLPTPPGALPEIDALDAQIAQLSAHLPYQRQITAQAQSDSLDAQSRIQAIGGSLVGATQRVSGHTQRASTGQANVAAQTSDMQARTATAMGSSGSGTQQAASPLMGIANTARTVDGLMCRIPSNSFFDVSSSQRSVHQFVVGIDSITGAGPGQAATRGQTDSAVAARGTQASEAASTHATARGVASQLQAQMNVSRADATRVHTSTVGVAQQSRQSERSVAQQLAAARQMRTQKYAALIAWAARHRAIREAATKAEEARQQAR